VPADFSGDFDAVGGLAAASSCPVSFVFLGNKGSLHVSSIERKYGKRVEKERKKKGERKPQALATDKDESGQGLLVKGVACHVLPNLTLFTGHHLGSIIKVLPRYSAHAIEDPVSASTTITTAAVIRVRVILKVPAFLALVYCRGTVIVVVAAAAAAVFVGPFSLFSSRCS